MATFRLQRSASGYELLDLSTGRSLRIDFASRRLKHRLRQGGRELLATAVRVKPGLRVLDATAGLGIDSLVLASRGCEVTMVERSHTLYLMLADALTRAKDDEHLSDIVSRMSLVRGDACYVMAHLAELPDVILVDPMFPPRQKSAAVRGDLQSMQALLGKDEDVRSLVLAARSTGCRRVVVKRPLNGADLPGLAPAFSVKGKASRFDVFVDGQAICLDKMH